MAEDIYFDYNDTDEDAFNYATIGPKPPQSAKSGNIVLGVLKIIIFLLGISGNGAVIWICVLKMKKSVNSTWYLSLAVSDFIFCFFLPFDSVREFTSKWVFGLFMCKFISFIMFLNMFSSIFLLVLISVDRCVSVVFPVWSQNHRSVRAASVLVVLAWVISTLCSIPSLIFRQMKENDTCYNNWDKQTHQAVAVNRFVFGFVISLIIITVCYTIIILKLKSNRMTKSSKPFKVMTALIVTFFICWMPYHVFILIEIDHEKHHKDIFSFGIPFSVTLACANSFMNPFLYAFMGKDFKKTFRSSLFSKIANAIDEDVQTTSKGQSNTLDSKISTQI
ncbi:hypothetical protein AGOR_G00055480 [Albula goreensis]|uniref:G-protein coupled receptors family 1 profile domain-containing protein n=1 Tax=Albula goreensis TaxID=1534307 RepID=A0A8T3E2Z7_9TELE|nr:hypothetical protein AGOR_G00055480 [Albula goreensis]